MMTNKASDNSLKGEDYIVIFIVFFISIILFVYGLLYNIYNCFENLIFKEAVIETNSDKNIFNEDIHLKDLHKTILLNTSKFNELIKKYLNIVNNKQTDTELISNLKKMETITEAIIKEIERDESMIEPKLRLARDFINYYQSKSIYFLDSLCNLISSGVKNSKFENTIRSITKTLYDFGNEYEKQYCKIMEIEIAKIEAQIKIHEMNSQ